MTRRPVLATALAWAALLVTAAVVTPPGRDLRIPDALWLLSWFGFALVGSLVLASRPGHAVGRLLLVGGLATPAATVVGGLAQRLDSGLISVVSLILFATGWITATALVLLVYPDGHLPSPRWRPVFATGVAAIVLVSVAILVNPIPQDPTTQVRSPLAVEALGSLPSRLIDAGVLVAGLVSLLALISLAVRWRRADGEVRGQLGWLCLGGLVVALLAVVSVCLSAWWPGRPEALGPLTEAVMLLVLPVVTGIAMLRHRLFDTDLALRRSLVAVLLTGLVVLTYAAIMGVASLVTGREAGLGAAVVAAVVVGAALVPVRDRLDRRVQRALYGDRRRPDRALAAVPGGASAAGAGDDVLALAVRSIRTSLSLGYVAVRTPDGILAAESGRPTAEPLATELVVLGESEGTLLVATAPGDTLRAADRELVASLAHQVALLARSVRLAAALQGSRERLVGAREAERARLRRDLHDGLGPVLAGLTLQVDALTDHLDPDAPDAQKLAAAIKTELRSAIGTVRHSVDGLRPPDLDQLGLQGALAEQAAALSTGATRISVTSSMTEQPDAATEVAAYRIGSEAMTNAARHSSAASCQVRVTTLEGQLRLTVADDGRGLDGASHGVGLTSMRERAEELGGKLCVQSTPDGTLVEALLPLAVGR